MQGNPDSGIREIPHAAAFFLLGIQAFLSTCNQALIRIKMAVQRKFVDKGLLKNVIRHTDASNKVGVYFCHIFIEFRFVLNIVLRKLLNHLASWRDVPNDFADITIFRFRFREHKKRQPALVPLFPQSAKATTKHKFVFAGYLTWDSLLKL